MPKAGHEHAMAPLVWTLRTEEEDAFPPIVVFGCNRGVCSKTVTIHTSDRVGKPSASVSWITPRSRTVPELLTEAQFKAMQGGAYWNEIIGAEYAAE